MNWVTPIDGYCERTGPGLWAEPVNALTNLAFILAAVIMLRRTRGHVMAQMLCLVLFSIGIGSALFHTFATLWAALADTLPIGIFILLYLYAVNRDIAGASGRVALGAVVLFFPYAYLVVLVFDAIPFLRISGFYWTVPLLLLVYGLALQARHPAAARGLLIGAALLSLSIILRSLDEILCTALPLGTHFLWHCLNGLMLGYMIHVYHTHVLAAGLAGRQTPR